MLWNGNECGKNRGDDNLKATIPNTNYDRSKTAGEYGILNYLGSKITNDARRTREINFMAKAAFNKKKTFYPRNWT